jgi:hypothetical protein
MPGEPENQSLPGAARSTSGREKGSSDFFVSYTRAGERWSVWIGWQLEAAGHQVRLMCDFRPGTDFVTEMHEALSNCDCTRITV